MSDVAIGLAFLNILMWANIIILGIVGIAVLYDAINEGRNVEIKTFIVAGIVLSFLGVFMFRQAGQIANLVTFKLYISFVLAFVTGLVSGIMQSEQDRTFWQIMVGFSILSWVVTLIGLGIYAVSLTT